MSTLRGEPRRGMMDRLDLMDPDLFRSGVPYDYFRWLRDNDPVAWHDEAGGSGYWLLTRYDDVVAAGRNWQRYSNELRGSTLEDPLTDEELEARRLIFVNQDPPRHTRTRKLVRAAFTPGHVKRLTEQIEQISAELVDAWLNDGTADVVETIGTELPFRMVATMFGVPREDWPQTRRWTLQITNWQEPELNEGLQRRFEIQRLAVDYARELIRGARRDPDRHGGILVDLLDAEIDRGDGQLDRLSDDELAVFILVVVIGGVVTTSHAITESIALLGRAPELLDEFDAHGGFPQSAVEELVRWASPAMNFRRTATEDHELRGVHIRRGDKVVLSFSSANHDERKFADPGRFDPWRSPNEHVGFGGGGPHFCLGAQLARLDIRLVLTEIVRRVGRIEILGPTVRVRSNSFAGHLHLPARATKR